MTEKPEGTPRSLPPKLLDPAFVRELEALRRLLRQRARSGRLGARSGRRRGAGAEFEEHRPYAPGDDVGHIDWAAFARTGQPVLKQPRADEDTVVRLLVDASRSLGFGEPRPLDVATRVAAGIAYLALSSERAQVLVAGRESVRASKAGRRPLGAVLRDLAAVEPEGQVDLAQAITRAVAASVRPGMLVVLSDFLDTGPVAEALRRARFAEHDVVLVQVLAPEVLDPTPDGDVRLEDAETGVTFDVTVDGPTLHAYRARLEALFDSLRGFARSAGATYVQARTDERLAEIVRRVLARAVD